MIPPLFHLSRATKSKAVETFSRAFQEDPLFGYLLPDPRIRREKLGLLFEVVVEIGLRHGEVLALDESIDAVALVLPNRFADLSWARLVASGGMKLLSWGVGASLRLFRFNNLSVGLQERFLPEPHHYLQLLAVEPRHHGRGRGRALLTAIQSRQREVGLPLYLETENEENLSFYRKGGFRVLESSRLPRSSVSVWSMVWHPPKEAE